MSMHTNGILAIILGILLLGNGAVTHYLIPYIAGFPLILFGVCLIRIPKKKGGSSNV